MASEPTDEATASCTTSASYTSSPKKPPVRSRPKSGAHAPVGRALKLYFGIARKREAHSVATLRSLRRVVFGRRRPRVFRGRGVLPLALEQCSMSPSRPAAISEAEPGSGMLPILIVTELALAPLPQV